MNAQRSGFFTAVIVAGFAASTLLGGCGSPARGNAAANEVPVSVVAASSKKHADPELKTFKFPDGHISFAYPATWTVRTLLPSAGIPGVEAIVTDDAGNDLLFLGNGFTAGCAGGPVSRRVLEQAAVPGMTAAEGTEPVFGFAEESYGNGNGVAYVMGLTDPRSLEEGEDVASWCNLVPTGNGGLSTRVLFNDGFPNRGAARAWMATDQYAQLKALLVSLTYV
ncbi:hypothetical protein [Arthrobacter sp.]|jgi:hypothetical protein|uniref:hypothetical protein n=1 Tax=Arthrobacter sp. TaxID=1667 RepID=UPI002F4188DD